MKVSKLNDYKPEYPAKGTGMKLGVIAAAAALAAGTALGCVNAKPEIMGDFPADTELISPTPAVTQAPETTGLLNFEETPECTESVTADNADERALTMGMPPVPPEASENP